MDSVEFQIKEKWERVLDAVATLEFRDEPVTFEEVLRELEQALQETLFAPESRNAPVQVLGVLESAGTSFDAVWFLRGSDAAWPRPTEPHPAAAVERAAQVWDAGDKPGRSAAGVARCGAADCGQCAGGSLQLCHAEQGWAAAPLPGDRRAGMGGACGGRAGA